MKIIWLILFGMKWNFARKIFWQVYRFGKPNWIIIDLHSLEKKQKNKNLSEPSCVRIGDKGGNTYG